MRKCNWLRHNFGKWGIKERGDILIEERVIGTFLIQERICQDCGYVEQGVKKNMVL